MSKSQRLRMADVRAVFRLIREVCELGDDPVAWRRHALAELCRLTGGIQGDAVVIRVTAADPARMQFVVRAPYGLDDSGRRVYDAYVARGDLTPDPTTPEIMRRFGRLVTSLREDLTDDPTWYRSEYFNEVRRVVRSDGLIQSQQPVMGGTLVDFMGLGHEMGELARVWDTPPLDGLADALDGLSPRQRQLADLLAGPDGEKQIAVRLGLSRHTVHNYVTTLYRRLGVGSRAELMARARPARQFRPRVV